MANSDRVAATAIFRGDWLFFGYIGFVGIFWLLSGFLPAGRNWTALIAGLAAIAAIIAAAGVAKVVWDDN